jgi:hypothetical protein
MLTFLFMDQRSRMVIPKSTHKLNQCGGQRPVRDEEHRRLVLVRLAPYATSIICSPLIPTSCEVLERYARTP